jgi:hypothetical protein
MKKSIVVAVAVMMMMGSSVSAATLEQEKSIKTFGAALLTAAGIACALNPSMMSKEDVARVAGATTMVFGISLMLDLNPPNERK